MQACGRGDEHRRDGHGLRGAEQLVHDEAFWLFVHTIDDLWGAQKDTGWRPYPTNYVVFYDYWKMIGQQAPASWRSPVRQ